MDPLSACRQPVDSAFAPGSFLGDLLGSLLNMNKRSAIARWRWGVGLLAFATVLFSSTLVVAQDYRGTAEQRASCMPDAFKLCASYIPDATKVEVCLRQRTSELSEACRSVFEQNAGSVATRIKNDNWRTN
jgi:hypothetical protein